MSYFYEKQEASGAICQAPSVFQAHPEEALEVDRVGGFLRYYLCTQSSSTSLGTVFPNGMARAAFIVVMESWVLPEGKHPRMYPYLPFHNLLPLPRLQHVMWRPPREPLCQLTTKSSVVFCKRFTSMTWASFTL